MPQSLEDKKKAIGFLIILSLFIDGFCTGFVFSPSPSPQRIKHRSSSPNMSVNSGVKPLTLGVEGAHAIRQPANISSAFSEYSSAPSVQPQAREVAPDLKPLSPLFVESNKPSTEQYLAAVESLEKSDGDSSPKESLTAPLQATEKLSPFVTWPKYQFELGPGSGSENFQTTIGPYTLSNSKLVSGTGYFARGQMELAPRFVVEGKFQSTSGTETNSSNIVADSTFQTNEMTLNTRYRFASSPNNSIGYYAGLGAQNVNDYRYSFFGSSTGDIVNRPETFQLLKGSVGAELNSYYLFRGRLEFNYYYDVGNSSQGNIPGYSFSLTDGAQYSIDGSISHILTGDMYIGLGLQYLYHAYTFTTNELGPTYQGSVTKSRLDAFLFLGVEL